MASSARGRGCKSDGPFRAAREFRSATYWPDRADPDGDAGYTVSITVHRFASTLDAARAVQRAAALVAPVPQVHGVGLHTLRRD